MNRRFLEFGNRISAALGLLFAQDACWLYFTTSQLALLANYCDFLKSACIQGHVLKECTEIGEIDIAVEVSVKRATGLDYRLIGSCDTGGH